MSGRNMRFFAWCAHRAYAGDMSNDQVQLVLERKFEAFEAARA